MAEIIKSIILGIVEGITEWLPISSTGHLILVQKLIPLNFPEYFKEMFDVVIQLGAIAAVVVFFWNKLWPFTSKAEGYIKKPTISLWLKVIAGTVPTGIAGLLLKIINVGVDENGEAVDAYSWIRADVRSHYVIAITLILYGVLFIVLEKVNKNRKMKIRLMSELNYKTAFLIGCFQALALVPGTSRSGATIVGAMIIGTSRLVAAEYSFFLAIPAMCGAGFLEILDYVEVVSSNPGGFSNQALAIVSVVTATITAFIVSLLAIKFLMGYIRKKDFTVFGWYRIALGIVVILFFQFVK